MENTNIFYPCVYSSIFYLIISIIAYYYKEFILSFTLFFLFLTSVNYHTNRNKINFIMDFFFVFLTITYTGYVLLNKMFKMSFKNKRFILSIFSLLAFFITAFIYFYEKFFCDVFYICENFHAILHFISSVCIFCVIIM